MTSYVPVRTTSANDRAVLDVEGLRMRYGDNDVLKDVTFQARAGEVLVLLGPNGAGKTTTIEILEGFRERSAGTVEVLGADPVTADDHWRARIGVVLQSWRDHPKWRVGELLAYLGSYYKPYSTDRIQRPWDPDELMVAVGLADQAGTEIRRLSGGQRRRLDVAIGLVGRPEILFLDEPTAGFDPEARSVFHNQVLTLTAEGSTTVLLTTHDLDEAEKLADRIVILDGGRIIADGTPDELARQIAGQDEVRWTLHGEECAQLTDDPTGFIFDLFQVHGRAVTDLDIRRSSLENTYLALVHQ